MSEDMRSEIPGMRPQHPQSALHGKGVGGRHRATPGTTGGGGYLNNCTDSESLLKGSEKIDPRIEELRRIGLHARWVGVAKRIGYDNFLEMWDELDASLDEESRKGFTIHKFKELKRFQRNRYIESLSQSKKAADIQQLVKDELGENLSKRQIARLMKAQSAHP